MKTLTVQFEHGSDRLEIQVVPEAFISYGAKVLSHCAPIRQCVEIASGSRFLQLGFPSPRSRGNFKRKLVNERVTAVRVEKSIKSILLIESAVGWPNQKQQRQVFQSVSARFPKGGPIQQEKIPFAPDQLSIMGPGLQKQETVLLYPDILSWDVKESLVVMRVKPLRFIQGRQPVAVFFTRDQDTAFQLGQALDRQELHCVELNDYIPAILLALECSTRPLLVYGIQSLPAACRDTLIEHGIEQLDAAGSFGFGERIPRAVEELIGRLSAP